MILEHSWALQSADQKGETWEENDKQENYYNILRKK